MEDKASKTEEATPKRLSDARKKGRVAKSPDLNSAASFFFFVMLMGLLGQYIYLNGRRYMENYFTMDMRNLDLTGGGLGSLFTNTIIQYGLMVLPFFAIGVVTALAVNLIQTGFLFSVEPLKPDLKKLNPIQGFKNLVSPKVGFNLVKNILKLILVSYITYKNLLKSSVQILNSGNIGTEKLFFFLLDFVKDLGFDIAIIMLALGVLDYVIQRWEYRKNLRMSIQDIKDEHKEMEGDPQIKSHRMQKQRQIAMSRMMQDIPGSTVVVTNPTHLAVVLRYDTEVDEVPVVTAKGADYVAERIKEVAREHDIPIIENKPLARTIYQEVEIGDNIPIDLYQAVAEILALVYEINEKKKYKI